MHTTHALIGQTFFLPDYRDMNDVVVILYKNTEIYMTSRRYGKKPQLSSRTRRTSSKNSFHVSQSVL